MSPVSPRTLLYCAVRISIKRATVVEARQVVFDEKDKMVSEIMQSTIPSNSPPRFLNPAQTCDAAICHPSPKEPPEHRDLVAPASQSPTSSVFYTTELLELILLQLDMRTRLVSASRVCRLWLETINQSPILQKASFFWPEEPPSPNPEPQLNPLLLEAFGEVFFDLDSLEQEVAPTQRAERFWRLPWSSPSLAQLRAPTDSMNGLEPTGRQRSFTRAGASWRRMLVSQPPPPFIGFMWIDKYPLGPGRRLLIDSLSPEDITSPLGVTMGQLYDAVQFFTMRRLQPSLSFRVRWSTVCERGKSARYDTESTDDTIERTHVVLEFWDKYDLSDDVGPFNMTATRSVFRCEEFVEPFFGGKATVGGFTATRSFNAAADEIELWDLLEWEE